jgi:hypothetical protein
MVVAWWPLFPCSAALTLRLAAERICGDPYDLLPALSSQSRWAWTLATVYLLAHLWVILAYVFTVAGTGALRPSWQAVRRLWGPEQPILLSMLGVLAIEYAPIPLWRLIGTSIGCVR